MFGKAISIGLALVVAVIFLLDVLSSGSHTFNLLPYLLHESISKGGAGEATFIRIFDILTGCLIFVIIYWLMNSSKKNKA